MNLFPTASGRPATERTFHWAFEWKPRYTMVGACWYRYGNCLDVWVCLLPCVPLHLCWWWHDPEQ